MWLLPMALALGALLICTLLAGMSLISEPSLLKRLFSKHSRPSAQRHSRRGPNSPRAGQPSAHAHQPALVAVLGLDLSGFATPQQAVSCFFQQQLKLKYVPPLVTSEPWQSSGGRSALYVAGPPSLISHVLRVKGRHLDCQSHISIHPCATWPLAIPLASPPPCGHSPFQQQPSALLAVAGGVQRAAAVAPPPSQQQPSPLLVATGGVQQAAAVAPAPSRPSETTSNGLPVSLVALGPRVPGRGCQNRRSEQAGNGYIAVPRPWRSVRARKQWDRREGIG